MICEACREHRHGDCRGGSWCDCQHRKAAKERDAPEAATGEDDAPERAADRGEPGVNWRRQG
ncbi:hypothetical protein [Actinomadura parmotrematis]|uniref:Uncharacterized protein n=1 Tax=Actinomadura parmotrematis TaxID=2864039 RepID=A0ABS7FQ27_9ACTN|nr:hypothetical protein [Actinomadura parmotrematis]MBW8482461.1 hypothetical protein [Actinomadura parmotrematis]